MSGGQGGRWHSRQLRNTHAIHQGIRSALSLSELCELEADIAACESPEIRKKLTDLLWQRTESVLC